MNGNNSKKVTTLTVGAALLLVFVGLGMAVYALTSETKPDTSTHSQTSGAHSRDSDTTGTAHHNHKAAPPASDVPAALTIEYSNNGFGAASYTVHTGETVRVINNSGAEMYFAAGEHEHHDITSPVNLGVIEPGEASSFIAPQAGSYLFHNHDNDEHTGTLIVQ